MVSPISTSGPTGRNTVDPARVGPTTQASKVRENAPAKTSTRDATATVRLASLGPPIDVTRVNEIRAAIANGTYTVDADRLAAAMLALDVPAKAE